MKVTTDGPNINQNVLFDINTGMKTALPLEKQTEYRLLFTNFSQRGLQNSTEQSRLDSQPVSKATVQTTRISLIFIQAYYPAKQQDLLFIL